jgi:hypothetical protein
MGKELYEGLNLMPPAEGFELYRHKNAEQMTTQGWSGCTGRGSIQPRLLLTEVRKDNA